MERFLNVLFYSAMHNAKNMVSGPQGKEQLLLKKTKTERERTK